MAGVIQVGKAEAARPSSDVRHRPFGPALALAMRQYMKTKYRLKRGQIMRASVGDRIMVRGHVGGPPRACEVLEVRGADAGPPYLVRWTDDGRVSILFPGDGATVQHFEHDTR